MNAREVLAGITARAEAADRAYPEGDIETVVASQDDVPLLVAAVEAVLNAHRPHNAGTECWRCGQPWPCLDFRDITAALEAGRG